MLTLLDLDLALVLLLHQGVLERLLTCARRRQESGPLQELPLQVIALELLNIKLRLQTMVKFLLNREKLIRNLYDRVIVVEGAWPAVAAQYVRDVNFLGMLELEDKLLLCETNPLEYALDMEDVGKGSECADNTDPREFSLEHLPIVLVFSHHSFGSHLVHVLAVNFGILVYVSALCSTDETSHGRNWILSGGSPLLQASPLVLIKQIIVKVLVEKLRKVVPLL